MNRRGRGDTRSRRLSKQGSTPRVPDEGGGSLRERRPHSLWAVPLFLVILGVTGFMVFFGRRAVFSAVAGISAPHQEIACFLGWALLTTPMWVAVAFVVVRRLSGRQNPLPPWTLFGWMATCTVSLSVIPNKRGSDEHYERELAEHAGEMGHAIGVGASAGILTALLMVPLGLFAVFVHSRLRPGIDMSARRAVTVALPIAVVLEVGALMLALAFADLRADSAVLDSLAGDGGREVNFARPQRADNAGSLGQPTSAMANSYRVGQGGPKHWFAPAAPRAL